MPGRLGDPVVLNATLFVDEEPDDHPAPDTRVAEDRRVLALHRPDHVSDVFDLRSYGEGREDRCGRDVRPLLLGRRRQVLDRVLLEGGRRDRDVLVDVGGRHHRRGRACDLLRGRRNLDLRRKLDGLQLLGVEGEILRRQLRPERERAEVRQRRDDHRSPEPRAERPLEPLVRGFDEDFGYGLSCHRLSLCMLCSNCVANTTRTTPASTSSFWSRSMYRYGTSRSPRIEITSARSEAA